MSILAALHQDIGLAVAEVADRLRPSVVQVFARGHGHGAGTVWREDGLIVTNHHVAPGAANEVRLADGRALAAAVIARDPGNDLAVLRVAATGLLAAPHGDARALRAGSLVLAIGHPFGIRDAVTVGMVAGPVRRPERDGEREMIQADVLLGPGNSGGPLANARGEVVGINSMVAGGVGLAVPSHLVEALIEPAVERPRLGVRLQDVELSGLAAARLGAARRRAALVVAVGEGSPAQRAGLIVGDIALAVDGQPVAGGEPLQRALAEMRAGLVRLSLLRGGEPREVLVQLTAPTERAA